MDFSEAQLTRGHFRIEIDGGLLAGAKIEMYNSASKMPRRVATFGRL